MRLCREQIRVLTTLPPPPTHTHTHTQFPPPPPPHTHTLSTQHTAARQCCRVVSTCSTCHTYAYRFQPYTDLFYMLYICIPFFSHTPTCATRHTYAYLFQPEAEVKDGVAGVCERCARCSYPQVFTVQQHVQMSVCVHPHPDTTARFDLT